MAEEDVSAESQEVPGHAPPDTGAGEGAESETPVGVDALDPEKVAAAREAGGDEAGGDEGGGDEGGGDEGGGGDGGAVDVSAAMGGGDDEPAEDAPPPDPEVVSALEGETGALTEALEDGGLEETESAAPTTADDPAADASGDTEPPADEDV